MSQYAVIVQNDESKWDDIKGDLYHYPIAYKHILTPGCKIIYYKGKLKNRDYLSQRLSPEPHYFGIGVIGDSIEDPESAKGDRYCEIVDYQEFQKGIPIKISNKYLEDIPKSKKANYWRFGVREISKDTFEKILSFANTRKYSIALPKDTEELESYAPIEGKRKARYTSYYERNPFYRNRAVEIHGLSCMGCAFNFEDRYGEWGRNFIHVHHNKPVSERGPTKIDPQTDMSVLCPNCHAMVHRNKMKTLTLTELKKLVHNKQII